MRGLILILALLVAGVANSQTAPTHGPYYNLDPVVGWQVYFDAAAGWYQLVVYDNPNLDPTVPNQSYAWSAPTSPTGWYTIGFAPMSSQLCTQQYCWANHDLDPWLDFYDNCTLIGNQQADFDGDNFGNPCDGDFNQTATVNTTDFSIFIGCKTLADQNGGVVTGSVGGIDCAACDMDTSGTITTGDFGLFNAQIQRGSPGPSGL